MDKQKQHEQVFKDLEKIANILPAPIYWLDTDGIVLGANDVIFTLLGGLEFRDKIIGRKHDAFYPKDIAETLTENNQKVIKLGQTIEFEERVVHLGTGVAKYATAVRSPIRDDEGTIIGVIGTSIDITDKKEAEQLRIANDNLMFENQRLEFENNAKQISAELNAYKKFKKIADQMAHDIGSPLMALSVLENHCAELPEAKRNMLRESISSIREIASSLLSQYKPQEDIVDIGNADKVLVYAVVEQIILEKQHEYHKLPIKFISEYEEDARFSFLEGNITSFKRMLSNIINNSVQAISNDTGIVYVKLDRNSQQVKVSIEDDGRGIDQEVINKLINNVPITLGKEDGHGIGFRQIHETLNQINGKISIESKPGQGTTVILDIPQIATPEWLAETITINPDDTIIILDDDSSIHSAWNIRFNNLLNSNSNLTVKHFTKAIDTTDYIASLSEIEKQRIFLLTDYELLKQNLNGLDVIAKTQVKRSILVTSHYNNPKIRQQASNTNTKVLPKILASFIPIKVTANI